MALRDRSATVSAVVFGVLGVMLGFPLVATCVIGLVMVLGDDPDGGVPLLVGGGAGFFVLVPVLLGSLALTAAMRRAGPAGQFVRWAQGSLGGTVRGPSMFRPGALPEVRTAVDGVETSVRAVVQRSGLAGSAVLTLAERSGAQFGAQPFGGRLQTSVLVDAPTPLRLAVITRTSLSGLGAGLFGLQPVGLGDPALDQTIAAYSNRPDLAWGLLSDPAARAALAELVRANYPYVARVSFSQDGASWDTVVSERVAPPLLLHVARTLMSLARPLGWPGPGAPALGPYR
jgi:hypothetical protein